MLNECESLFLFKKENKVRIKVSFFPPAVFKKKLNYENKDWKIY